MKCPQCGTENQSGFKFCVKCGLNLENPNEVNIEQVDMGGYHSEDDASSSSVYTIGSGTFTISDRPSTTASSALYTADELNDTDEEFDFSGFDEPFIPKLDADRVSLPEQISHPHPQPQMQANNYQANQYSTPAAPPQPNNNPYQMAGIPPQNTQQIGGIPQQMYQQPQIIGYDQNGMPVYSQPVMYQQPQIIGYDQNGMPLYGQPVMYQQPQFMGYDQNGMPVYGQPVMYQQPQFMGYDQNGMPVYGQPVPYQNAPVMGGMPAMQSVPQPQMQQPAPPAPPQQQQPQEDKRVDVPDDFWEFFDGGKATKHKDTSNDDFFGKHSGEMDDLSTAGADLSRLKRFEHKRNDYMGDTPIADASALVKNDDHKFNRLYMRQTDIVNADQLEYNEEKKTQDRMRVTREVSADSLAKNNEAMRWDVMGKTAEADAGKLQTYVPEHKQAIMAHADHAVEALPSKKKTYNDVIDEIELPEHMKAKKTARTEAVEIPSLPELQDLFSQG